MLAGAAATGQSKLESFYGLKLGEKYSERTVINALRASGIGRGTPIVKDTLPSFGRLSYTVDGMLFRRSDTAEPIKTTVTVIVSPDNTFDAVVIVPDAEDAEPMTFVSDAAAPEIQHLINANVDSVEGEFFGLKLGSGVSLVSIIKALGDNGSYLSSRNEGKARVHSFKDVTYAGHEWDYALFSITPAGKLVAFTVYDVYEGALKGYRPANKLHIEMRNAYFPKYGFSIPYSDDDDEILNDYVFTGRNGVDHAISFFETKADSGKDAYCVQMEFVHFALSKNL